MNLTGGGAGGGPALLNTAPLGMFDQHLRTATNMVPYLQASLRARCNLRLAAWNDLTRYLPLGQPALLPVALERVQKYSFQNGCCRSFDHIIGGTRVEGQVVNIWADAPLLSNALAQFSAFVGANPALGTSVFTFMSQVYSDHLPVVAVVYF